MGERGDVRGTGRRHDREILRLAVPAFAALVAEPLFLLTDSAIIGHVGTGPLAALGVAGPALATIVNLCVFLAYGTTAAVARQIGAGDMARAMRQGMDGLWLAALLGGVLALAGWPLAPWIVDLLGASPNIAGMAVTYLRISLLGVPGLLIVLAGTGVLRGMQDTLTPLVVSVGSFAANALLNIWFVVGLGWGVSGSAWGTVIAQTAGGVVYVIAVVRGARRHGAALSPDLAGLKAAGTSGFALFVRTLSLRVVMVVATAIAARVGDVEVAAQQLAFQIWTLLAFALDAIAIAGQAITGRSLGAGDVEGTRSATRRMVIWGVGSGVVLGLLVVAARPHIPGIFTPDARVAHELLAALWAVALLQPIAGLVFVLDGVLIGAGDQRYLAWTGVVNTLTFLPAAWLVIVFDGGLIALWAAIALWMLSRAVTLSLRARGTSWLVTGVPA
ncbi:MATE family efflux transporter [Bailinhaonella thermotolerans]|uniref:MATE family efflux transporter n=1 Tax=Bailinhaonella thermotolerans TaxID=1070861 RepID=A0A3A4BM53_9ACTN|nr:MATE family efflux transporter [Bailinhaonella thermotolerans]RJL32112.1 MATE family efflux transporter [Bailinhaonella thermotolerans]